MQNLWQDLKFALRMLRKNPGFTAVAILTLALGIGANTAIFSVINTVLLQPLPFKEPGRIINLVQYDLKTKASGALMSYTKYTQIQEQSKTLESMAGFYPLTLSLVTDREPEAVNGARASIDFFRVLGISPAHGRAFLPEEEQDGGPDVAVISDGFWHSHFAGDPAALGKALVLDGKSATIVGILPGSFRFPLQYPEPDVWLPRPSETVLLTPAQVRGGASYFNMIARLRPEETLQRASAELDAINASYKQQFGSNADATKFGILAQTLEESLVGGLRPSLLVLLAAVGFVLLIACANVANLLLARATARDREIAVRKALGASGGRLVRQLLSESILLSVCGGVLGVFLAAALMPASRSISPGAVPRLGEAKIDGVVMVFSLLLCVITGIAFGLVPALQTSKKDLHEILKEGGRGSSESGSRGRFRALLVVAEIGIALVLMTGAGLLIQSFSRLMQVDPGFSPKNLMTFPLTLPPSRYSKPELQAAVLPATSGAHKIHARSAGGRDHELSAAWWWRAICFCLSGRIRLPRGWKRSDERGAAGQRRIFRDHSNAASEWKNHRRKRSRRRIACRSHQRGGRKAFFPRAESDREAYRQFSRYGATGNCWRRGGCEIQYAERCRCGRDVSADVAGAMAQYDAACEIGSQFAISRCGGALEDCRSRPKPSCLWNFQHGRSRRCVRGPAEIDYAICRNLCGICSASRGHRDLWIDSLYRECA